MRRVFLLVNFVTRSEWREGEKGERRMRAMKEV